MSAHTIQFERYVKAQNEAYTAYLRQYREIAAEQADADADADAMAAWENEGGNYHVEF